MRLPETVASKYDLQNFLSSGPDGEALWHCREIMDECLNAISTGQIQYWFPTMELDKDKVEYVIKKIDDQWAHEATYRDSRYGGCDFSNQLTWPQKACLVQRLKETMSKYYKAKPTTYTDPYLTPAADLLV